MTTYKFHISPKTGVPSPCHAEINCPLGGQHFETLQEAQKYVEKNV